MTSQAHQELLALSIRNAGKSIPVLLFGAAVVAWNGLSSDQHEMAAVVAFLAIATSVWRILIAARIEHINGATRNDEKRVRAELLLCAMLAGVMWSVATFGIYPGLNSDGKALHLVAVTGLVASAGHFMSLVKWAYPSLVGPSLGSLIIVFTFDEKSQSMMMSTLLMLYAVTLLRAGKQYRETTETSILRRQALEDANEDLVLAKRRADESASATSRFLATMSHEIRTPMNGVLGSLDILRRSALGEAEQRLVKTAATCGESLMALLDDALDHAKVESGRIDLQFAPIPLHTTAATVVNLFQSSATSKGIRILLVVDQEVPEWVVADEQRLKQVLLNLVSNAVKFTEVGAVTLRLSKVGLSCDPVTVRFEVRDSGPGMTRDQIERLFIPFSQVNRPASGTSAGTGLGLTISKSLVELMGGKIDMHSEPGVGSVFSFSLQMPAQPSSYQDRARVDSYLGLLDGMTNLSGTVLVVDDDSVNRLVARSMLESFGLAVLEATDGLEALATTLEHNLDLILMDCQMPGMNGYACSREIRAFEATMNRARVPIIALTATAFQDDVKRAFESGMDAHISKPYSRLHLRNEIANWL